MERHIKMWEFLIGVLAIIITVGGIVYTRGTMDAQNEIRITVLQQQFEEFKRSQKSDIDKLNDKIDKNNATTNEILILLQNKEDRK
jgi:Tfp pilus assembly protein PilN